MTSQTLTAAILSLRLEHWELENKNLTCFPFQIFVNPMSTVASAELNLAKHQNDEHQTDILC